MMTAIGTWRNIDKPKGLMIGNDSKVQSRNCKQELQILGANKLDQEMKASGH